MPLCVFIVLDTASMRDLNVVRSFSQSILLSSFLMHTMRSHPQKGTSCHSGSVTTLIPWKGRSQLEHPSFSYSPRVPEDYRCGKALGPVESLQEHPQDSAKILIGYSRGLMVLWDRSSREVHHLFLGNQVGCLAGLMESSSRHIPSLLFFCRKFPRLDETELMRP